MGSFCRRALLSLQARISKVHWWRYNLSAAQNDVSSGSINNALDDAVEEVAILTNVGSCWPDGFVHITRIHVSESKAKVLETFL